MNCCSGGVQASKETAQKVCGRCGEIGRAVARRTVVHHVKSEKLFGVSEDEYNFCASLVCPVVYYAGSGQTFTVEDMRESVTSKTSGDARPLCYCFGFTEGFARREIAQTGETSVAHLISRFITEKLCVCEIRNPAGACCLGEVNKTVKRLMTESVSV
jgi:hypothetical protein